MVVLGEDIADPYGGAFKVTRGLTTAYPDRVLTTPVSEAGMVGVAAGLAMSGYRPIVEIMFGDFVSLAFDQIVNHVTKYPAMYAGRVTCPVIVRVPSGGHRGYGPTHSQSLEKHFLGVPGLMVVAASPFHDPAAVLGALLQRDEPVIYVEHKLLYAEPIVRPDRGRVGDAVGREGGSPGSLPTVTLSFVDPADCTATVLAYGYTGPPRDARARGARHRGGGIRRAGGARPAGSHGLGARCWTRSIEPAASSPSRRAWPVGRGAARRRWTSARSASAGCVIRSRSPPADLA